MGFAIGPQSVGPLQMERESLHLFAWQRGNHGANLEVSAFDSCQSEHHQTSERTGKGTAETDVGAKAKCQSQLVEIDGVAIGLSDHDDAQSTQ